MLTGSNGQKISPWRHVDELAKRIQTIDTYIEENILHKVKVYQEIEQKYRVLVQKSAGVV